MEINKIKAVNIIESEKNYTIVAVNSVGTILFSYYKKIAVKTVDGVLLDGEYWNYSKTTAKHRNRFLGETTKETEAKIHDNIE